MAGHRRSGCSSASSAARPCWAASSPRGTASACPASGSTSWPSPSAACRGSPVMAYDVAADVPVWWVLVVAVAGGFGCGVHQPDPRCRRLRADPRGPGGPRHHPRRRPGVGGHAVRGPAGRVRRLPGTARWRPCWEPARRTSRPRWRRCWCRASATSTGVRARPRSGPPPRPPRDQPSERGTRARSRARLTPRSRSRGPGSRGSTASSRRGSCRGRPCGRRSRR